MKQTKIIYVIIFIIIIVILFIYINKNILLEGYSHIPNILYTNTSNTIKRYNNQPYSVCETNCNNSTLNCIGFTSTIPKGSNPNKKGNCVLFNNGFSRDNISGMTHSPGNHLYIK
jgi:hypothetical protein